jgi:thiol-disulfide isomerase/thioredoxin
MRPFITTLAGVLVLTLAVRASDQPEADAGTAQRATTAQPASEAAGDAAKFLDETAARYRKLKTYQDEAEVGLEVVAKDKDGGDAGQKQSLATRLKFRAPNFILIEREDESIQCDGAKLWQIRPEWKQYTEQVAPPKLDAEELLGNSGAPFGGHPIVRLLLAASGKRSAYFPELGKLREVRAETRAGRAGHVLVGDIELSFMGEGAQKSELWFDDADGLLREIHVDLTESYRKQLAAMEHGDEDEGGRPAKIERAEIYVRLDQVKADADLPAEMFTYKPAEGVKKVAEFDESERPGPEDLIDKPAPAFGGDDLAGEKLSLEGLKGRVVVLDFWATWCGPCVAAIPHIQKLADKFKDQPVTVMGVNGDDKGKEAKVRKFLETKKITLRQFMDADGSVAKKYLVSGIPSLFIIDKEGVIRDAHVGFSGEGMVDELAEKIAKLIKGEKIDHAAPAKRAGAQEEQEEESGGRQGKGPARLPDIAPERLVTDDSLRVKAGSDLRSCDVDGDGKSEWVSSTGAQLVVLSADGRESKTVNVASRSDGNINAYEPVRIGTKVHWLAALTSMSNNEIKAVTLVLCDSEGERMWNTELEVPAKSQPSVRLAAGDLLGNGKPCFAVALTLYSMGGGMPSGYVHVLDTEGKLLLRRKISGYGVGAFAIIPGATGQPGRLLVGDGRSVRAYTLGPAGANGNDPNNPPVRPAVEEKAKRADDEH